MSNDERTSSFSEDEDSIGGTEDLISNSGLGAAGGSFDDGGSNFTRSGGGMTGQDGSSEFVSTSESTSLTPTTDSSLSGDPVIHDPPIEHDHFGDLVAGGLIGGVLGGAAGAAIHVVGDLIVSAGEAILVAMPDNTGFEGTPDPVDAGVPGGPPGERENNP